MTTYSTGNPLGSSDPRDLYDNAENLDNLVNGEQPAYSDRLGKSRRSWQSVEDQVNQQESEFNADQVRRESEHDSDQSRRESEFQASQDDREGVFNAYLVSAGYQFAGDYAAGIEITQYNQVVRDTNGEFWRAAGSTTLPYTTTGAGLPEGGAFVAVGDAALRQELNSRASGQGADLIPNAVKSVENLTELIATPGVIDGQAVSVQGSEFRWNASVNQWEPTSPVWVTAFGAVGDGGTDDTAAVQQAGDSGWDIYVPEGKTVAFGNVLFNSNPSFYGPGEIKRINADGTNWIRYANCENVTFDGITIDANNYEFADGHCIDDAGNGSRFFTFKNCTVKNIVSDVFRFISEPNIGVKVTGNRFIGSPSATEAVTIGGFNSCFGLEVSNNYFERVGGFSGRVSSGLDQNANPGAGKVHIINNEFRLYPMDDGQSASGNLTMILIRANDNKVYQDVVIANNTIEGGKIGINVGGGVDNQKFNSVIVSGNTIKNCRDLGIKVGETTSVCENVLVFGNIIDSVRESHLEGTIQRGIRTYCKNFVISKNIVRNMTESGIFISDSDGGSVSENIVEDCLYDSSVNVGNASGAGIYLYTSAKNTIVSGNTVKNCGWEGSTQTTGILLGNTTTVTGNLIEGNKVYDDNAIPVMAIGINPSRWGPAPHAEYNVFRNNIISGVSRYALPTRLFRTYTIQRYNNIGTGEVEVTWNPGTVAAGDTVELVINDVASCQDNDEAQVISDSLLKDSGLSNSTAWLLSARVTTPAYDYTGAKGAITVYLTNLTGASQAFSDSHEISVKFFNTTFLNE